MITVTGKTFEHRPIIRAFGGYWNNYDKCWQFDRLTPRQIADLKSLPGVIVTETAKPKPEPTTNPASIIDVMIGRIMSGRTSDGRLPSRIYGDDQAYHNAFADQNPRAFFGFSSLETFINYLDALPSSITGDTRRSGWERDDGDWRGTKTMREAIDLARHGWLDGLERATDVIERLSLTNPRVKRRHPSLAGGAVSVGRMLAGDPAHMIRRPKAPGRKVVTFYVEAGCNAWIESESLIDRAAIVGAIVDIMENVGYSCEIVAVDTSMEMRTPMYQLAVRLKEAGERLNLMDLMFALGHPSFLRRFSFAACSSADETRDIWGSQGLPSNAFNDEHRCKPNEFYVPVLQVNSEGDPLDLLAHVIPDKLPVEIKRD